MMPKFRVAFKVVSQPGRQEIELETGEPGLSCDIVLRALGRHLFPSEEWPFAVDPADCPAGADASERELRKRRMQAAREYLGVIYVSYRPEGAVMEHSC
ncbi:hypothetical protein [Herbaspirillum sp. NPDC087042]|uniref:hypothetical protein n=1 Tax=Herbaspirillum sp. NPDC087042 TaxID=3364004 RepID=UPI00381BEE12